MEASTPFIAGSLYNFVDEWRKLTNDPYILDIVEHCHLNIVEDGMEYLYQGDLQYRFNSEEQRILSQEIVKLLELQVLKVTQRRGDQVLSPVFLRKKKHGGYRMVLNLEKLNKHIPYQHFKMENFEQAVCLVNRGDYMASVDLENAYYTVKIAEEQQRFLCFKWQGKVYQYTCLPNGVAEGPRLFTKLMKPIFATLRNRGFTITSFIDDTLMCASSLERCNECVHDTVELLQRMGFTINVEKSVLAPTKCIEYLGNVIDSENMIVKLPVRRLDKIIRSCSQLLLKTRERIREVARVTGLLVAAIPAVELGKVHYRKLEMEKIAALGSSKGDFDSWMRITEEMKADCIWWVDHVSSQHRVIMRPAPDIELFTDASDLGWGGCLYTVTVNGRWSQLECDLHINAKELKAILFTLKSFNQSLIGRHIKVYCDNMTAVTYINEMGGVKSVVCNGLCIEIWNWCLENNAWITCSYIPGKENSLADSASRKFNDRHEWKLDVKVFQELCVTFGTPTIDLFASRLNRQVVNFCSWGPDPEANFIDAFAIDWAQFELIYCFPPFSLIARCLQKIRAEGCRGWIVVPFWPSQPWMGALLQLLVAPPRLIMQKRGLLRHPASEEDHPIMRHTRLLACLLSGRLYENKAYLQQVRTSSWHPGSQAPESNIDHTLLNGNTFVVDGTLIPLIPHFPA